MTDDFTLYGLDGEGLSEVYIDGTTVEKRKTKLTPVEIGDLVYKFQSTLSKKEKTTSDMQRRRL